MAKTFRIYDELYGYIRLSHAERTLIDTAVFQRLRRIKQLSLASLVYPGAEHTRFSHSVGVAYNVQIIGDKLKRLGLISDDELVVVRAAALLHDIGHLPFSHALEYAYHVRYGVQELKLHEEVTLEAVKGNPEVREALWYSGIDPQEIASVLEGKHRNPLLSSMLSGELDADRLDYLPRDALHTGVAYGLIDRDRLIDTITVDSDGKIAIHVKGVQALENFYIARLHMYRAVYYHKTVTAYTLLLSRLFEHLAEEDPDVASIFTREGILKAARTDDFAFLDDSWLLTKISQAAKRGGKYVSKLARDFLFRRGPKLIYERLTVDNNDSKAVKHIVEKLEKCVPSEAIYVYLDKVKVKDKTKPLTVITEHGEYPVTDSSISPLISSLPAEIHFMRIYVDRMYAKRARECLAKLERKN